MADRVLRVIDQKVRVSVAGGPLVAALAAVAAQPFVTAAEAAKDAAEAALSDIEEIASGAPEAPSIANKVNLDGANATTPTFRLNIGVPAGSLRSLVKDFGVTVSGATDITAALQAAAAAGENIYIDPSDVAGGDYYVLEELVTLAAPGQQVRGFGRHSRIVQMGEEANSSVFFIDGIDDATIADLWLTPGTVTTNQLRGYAVYFREAAGALALRLQVSGHRRGAILFEGCSRSAALRNFVHSSVINAAIDDHSTSGVDIFIANGGEDIEISENLCDGGAGTGIGAQSQGTGLGGIGGGPGDGGYDFRRIKLRRNTVRNQGMYGALAYQNNFDDIWDDFSIAENIINDITGAIPHSDLSNRYRFGAGVYVASARLVDIVGNRIARVCTETDNESLAPAGIGITGCTELGDISGNTITDSAYHGIAVFDPNGDGTAGATTKVGENKITGSGGLGYAFRGIPLPAVAGGEVTGCGGAGLRVTDAGSSVAVRTEVRGLVTLNNGGPGVAIDDGDSLLSGISSRGNQQGLLIDGTGSHKVEGGELSDNDNWGLVVNSANPTNIETAGIKFRNNDQADIYCDVPIKGLETNDYGTTGTRFQGPFAEPRALANSATPSVKNGRQFTTGGTTTITSLSDMTDQQEVIIKAAHSVTVLGVALTSGKVLRAVNMGGTQNGRQRLALTPAS